MAKGTKTFSWMNPKLEVRDTGKYGKGVFAKGNIEKNEILSIFGGYVMLRSEEVKLSKGISDNAVKISESHVLGAKKISELEDASFFNHSCNPNAGFQGQIFLVAMRGIKKDEQITFDYAMVLSKTKGVKFYKVRCLCGEKECRNFITDNDWKISKLQKKYKDYFQFYLQEKIKNLHTIEKYKI